MDLTTIIGLLLALAMLTAAAVMGGGSFAAFCDLPSLLMVLGGTTGAAIACFPLRTVIRAPHIIAKSLRWRPAKPAEVVTQLVALSETARRDGLLALESKVAGLNNAFLTAGVQMAVDGTRPEIIEEVLRSDTESMLARHREGKSLFDQLAKFAPAFGMIGTLVGLIIMLGHMSDPGSIGSGMAVALITTLYGTVLSNAAFLPLAEKLANLSKHELLDREIIIRGVLAIQSGENPRLIHQKLSSLLPPGDRLPRPATDSYVSFGEVRS
jgi:chemotaxis protein MotA